MYRGARSASSTGRTNLGSGRLTCLAVQLARSRPVSQLRPFGTITSKSDQSLEKIEVKVAEEYSTGRGKEKKTKTFDLGGDASRQRLPDQGERDQDGRLPGPLQDPQVDRGH